MSKKYRNWSPDQTWLLPPSPRDWLDDSHLVYFLLDVVGEMDLSPFFDRYKNSVSGQPPYHPRMMVTLLLYAYCSGVFSSRKIQARCSVDVAFRVIVGEDIPNFRTISDFRKDNLAHMQSLFVQMLQGSLAYQIKLQVFVGRGDGVSNDFFWQIFIFWCHGADATAKRVLIPYRDKSAGVLFQIVE